MPKTKTELKIFDFLGVRTTLLINLKLEAERSPLKISNEANRSLIILTMQFENRKIWFLIYPEGWIRFSPFKMKLISDFSVMKINV